MSEELTHIVSQLRGVFDTGRTLPLSWRRRTLIALERLLVEQETALAQALKADLGKPAFEIYSSEVGFVLHEVRHALSKLKHWMKPRPVALPLAVQPGRARIVPGPKGVVLVIGAWNYPVQLLLAPLTAALAAGNAVVLKPSELAPATSRALAALVPRYLDPEVVAVVEGGIEVATALLAAPFDHIFFTGSPSVGKVVMAAAATRLVPVTLELGGKSPCFVDPSAKLALACRRIAWGKLLNAGQTCVAPDYALVHESLAEPFQQGYRAAVEGFFGLAPAKSPDYARIVNERHFARLSSYLAQGHVAFGGDTDPATRYFGPTLLTDVPKDAPVMQDEIFGPILPLVIYRSLDEALRFVRERPKPLALYVFAEDREVQARVLAETTSGGACFNDTIVHMAVPDLPFGGVGSSGMGAYHGRHGFDTFSHQRAVLEKSTWIDPSLRYPPYTPSAFAWLRRLM